MTISSDVTLVSANGNGVTTVFSFSPLKFFASTELQVIKVSSLGVETVLTEGTGTSNYSVSLNDLNNLPTTGSLTYPATLGTALAVGESIVMKYNFPLTQPSHLTNQGGYNPHVQEQNFDRAALHDIQMQEEIDRSIKVTPSNFAIDTDLPDPVANTAIGWNATATGMSNLALTITADISSALIVVSGSQPGLVDGRIWIDTSTVGQHIIKLCDGADYNEVLRQADAGGALQMNEILTILDAVVATVTGTSVNLALTTIDNGATGVNETTDHSSASPANNDIIWKRSHSGRDSGGGTDVYAEDQVVISDTTAASEDAIRKFRVKIAGTLADRFLVGGGGYTPSVTDKGADTLNATGLYLNNTLVAASDVSIQSGAAHSPVLADHGKTFIYTNAGGCTITLPAIAGLFAGWSIGIVSMSAAAITANRAGADTIITKGTALTTIKWPTSGDSGRLIVDATNTRFFHIGRRSFVSADFAATLSTATVNAHNLGVIPDAADVKTLMVNTIANNNYNPGDLLDPTGFSSAAAASGYANVIDNTNITTLMGVAGMSIPNKTTFASVAALAADWNFRTTAKVIN